MARGRARDYDPYDDGLPPIRENPLASLPPEDEDEGDFDARAHAEELQQVYGIRPTMSLRTRVSRLHEVYDYKDVADVATTLRLSGEERRQAAIYLKDAQEEMEALGREQTPAEIARHKGLAIRRLERLRADLEVQIPQLPADKISAVANQIKGIEAQILTIRGGDRRQSAKEEGPDFGSTLIERIAALPTERIAELRRRMATAG